jgi:hypothetical protein
MSLCGNVRRHIVVRRYRRLHLTANRNFVVELCSGSDQHFDYSVVPIVCCRPKWGFSIIVGLLQIGTVVNEKLKES